MRFGALLFDIVVGGCGMSSSRKTMNEFASMFQDHVNWLGRYGSVPRWMALRIVNVQAGEVLDRIPRLLALERVLAEFPGNGCMRLGML